MELVTFDPWRDVKHKILKFWWKLVLKWESGYSFKIGNGFHSGSFYKESHLRLTYSYHYLYPTWKLDVCRVKQKRLIYEQNTDPPVLSSLELLPLFLVKNVENK